MADQIPEEAINAAAEAISRELNSGDIYQTHVEHDEHLARLALEAAVPAIREAERELLGVLPSGERDAVLADLAALLNALGLGDHARPQSPHEVMRECIAEAQRLRKLADSYMERRTRRWHR